MDERRQSYDEILGRIDERTMEHTKKLDELTINIEKGYVKKEAFDPVRNLVFGLTGLICMGVILAILRVVIKAAN